MKLRIYSDKMFLPKGVWHVMMLYPFWGSKPENERDPGYGAFDKYARIGHDYFDMTPIQNADYAVLPFDWTHTLHNKTILKLALRFIDIARKWNKKTIVFFGNDSEEPILIDDIIVFRPSLYKSRRRHDEYAMPALSVDFNKYIDGSHHQNHVKQIKPRVGFCGSGNVKEEMSTNTMIKRVLLRTMQLSFDYRKLLNPGIFMRGFSLYLLSERHDINTSFIIKNEFFGGAIKPRTGNDYELMNNARIEYVNNMLNTDYNVCCRGNGNFSFRFYETMSCGRIPVFINTDCVLPYDFIIDYPKHIVWAEEKDIMKLPDNLCAFHNKLSPAELIEAQQKCRKIWVEYLSPEGFFKNLYRHFRGI